MITVQIDKVDDKVIDEDRKKSCAEDLRCCATPEAQLRRSFSVVGTICFLDAYIQASAWDE